MEHGGFGGGGHGGDGGCPPSGGDGGHGGHGGGSGGHSGCPPEGPAHSGHSGHGHSLPNGADREEPVRHLELLSPRTSEVFTPTVDLGPRKDPFTRGLGSQESHGARKALREELRAQVMPVAAKTAPPKAEAPAEEKPYPLVLAIGLLALAVVVIVFLGTRVQ